MADNSDPPDEDENLEVRIIKEEQNDEEEEDEEEGEEDENPEPPSNRLDFDKLFRMCEDDEDIQDIMRSPIDIAIHNLEDGKEFQQLSAIRQLPQLLDTDEENARDQLIPVIQNTLKNEKANLDMHCEAAVVYKSILHNDSLIQKIPGLMDNLLECILFNISAQKEKLSAAAWLETLIEVSHRVPLSSVQEYILPVVQQQAEPTQRVQRRIIAAKLVQKLADILPSTEIRKSLGQSVHSLCQDPNSNVRTAMAQRLHSIANAIKNERECVSLVLPCVVELCSDEDTSTREAALNSLSQCMPYMTQDALRKTVFPLIKKATEDSIDRKDETLVAVAKNLGQWCYYLRDVFDTLDTCWLLNTYCKLVQVGEAKNSSTDTQVSTMIQTNVLRMTAYNFPCMMQLLKRSFDRLLPIFQSFCTSADDEVRLAIAAAYHEILQLNNSSQDLIPPFIELIRGGASEVIAKITFNLDKILPVLYDCTKEKRGNSSKVTRAQIGRILIGCNTVLRSTGSWRSHEAFLTKIMALKSILSPTQLFDNFVPLLKREVLQVRAIPCRIAAAKSLLVFTKEHPVESTRQEIFDFFEEEIGEHICSYRRMLYIDVALIALELFSRQFFIDNFLEPLLKLTKDPVRNVRLKAVRCLPQIKGELRLPQDNDTLISIERCVSEALAGEKHNSTRELLQKAACELSRKETKEDKYDLEDARKQREESELWSEERKADVFNGKEESIESDDEDTSSKNNSNNTTTLSIKIYDPDNRKLSPWRTERRAIAIVKPQPIVVMREYRSPSPAPSSMTGVGTLNSLNNNHSSSLPNSPKEPRPSRLPLSTSSVRERGWFFHEPHSIKVHVNYSRFAQKDKLSLFVEFFAQFNLIQIGTPFIVDVEAISHVIIFEFDDLDFVLFADD
ncbi:hypothetical protein WR25_02336 [Diploscapter pachys]|uniref:Condensin complex subunit 1 C-terminal domain-containing protein n=1 Tax=Diploscapter pachys TaxID=2018661 RepID=A0A2A2K0X8_9BILA|nr:hypothetical protein WR25_02336 [Diploscapter pachys]